MKEKVLQYEKLKEELKLLRSRASSMATPRDDTRRSRATSEQSAMSEDEDVGLQKRAKEA